MWQIIHTCHISFEIFQPLSIHISIIIDAGPRNQVSLAVRVVFSAATDTESEVFPVPVTFQLSMPEERDHKIQKHSDESAVIIISSESFKIVQGIISCLQSAYLQLLLFSLPLFSHRLQKVACSNRFHFFLFYVFSQ